jgi:hypothetical protein
MWLVTDVLWRLFPQSISGNSSRDALTIATGELRSCLASVKSKWPFCANNAKALLLEAGMFHPEDTFPEQEWMTDEATSSTRRMRDQGTRSDQRLGILPRQPSSYPKDDQVATTRAPIGRRIVRTLTRFFITVLIGVGATLAWQSYGDAARETMAAQSPLLAWLLPASQTQPPLAAVGSPDQTQQLAPLASNLETIRRSVERLAAKQDQMAQTIVLLQATEEDIREKIAFASAAQQTAGNPSKPPQARAQPAAPRALAPAGAVPR